MSRQFLVSVKFTFAFECTGAGGALVRSEVTVHQQVCPQIAALCKCFGASRALVRSVVSVHQLVFLQVALQFASVRAQRAAVWSKFSVHQLVLLEISRPDERLGAGGALVRSFAGVNHLVELEITQFGEWLEAGGALVGQSSDVRVHLVVVLQQIIRPFECLRADGALVCSEAGVHLQLVPLEVVKVVGLMNALEQVGHWCGRSPVWIIWWRLRSLSLLNDLEQKMASSLVLLHLLCLLLVINTTNTASKIHSRRIDPSSSGKESRRREELLIAAHHPRPPIIFIPPRPEGAPEEEEVVDADGQRRRPSDRLRPPLPFSRRAMRRTRLRWLVSGYFPRQAFEEGVNADENPYYTMEHLDPERVMQALLEDAHLARNWLYLVMAPNTEYARHFLNVAWELQGRYSGFSPEAYFTRGADFVRELPIGRWLARADITPSNTDIYERAAVEAVLTERLGSPSFYRLLCYHFPFYNPAVIHFAGVRVRPPRPYMLFAVRVCYEGLLGDRLADCERDDRVLDPETMIPGVGPCRQFFYYYKTVFILWNKVGKKSPEFSVSGEISELNKVGGYGGGGGGYFDSLSSLTTIVIRVADDR
ncbi:hypothetical protein TYRP_001429 [Tyrophagus putrescentiae]|nr:hypothetical protein TYRP_001429 [Tyrophagus putrescentiae]